MANYHTPEFLPSVWKYELMLNLDVPGSCLKLYKNVPETKLHCLQLSVLKRFTGVVTSSAHQYAHSG